MNPDRLRAAGAFLVALLAANLLAAWYVTSERAVYYWDLANYWNLFDLHVRLLRTDPLESLRTLAGSVKYAEYNGIPAVLLAPFGLLFGTSRLVFVLGVTTLYALPAAALAGWAAAGQFPERARAAAAAGFALALLCAAWWHPVLRGFVDIGALIPGFALAGLWLRLPARDWRVRHILLAGTLMAAMLLFRRIFAYWVVGFGLAAVLVDALPALARRASRAQGWTALGKLAAAAAVMVALLLACAAPMTVAMIRNDYTAMYAMYQSGRGALTQAWIGVGYFGLPLALAAAIGLVRGLRDPRRRRAAAFWAIQVATGFLTLIRVTDFHRHHYYVLLPGLLLLALLAVPDARPRWTAALPALLALGSALAFAPPLAGLPAPVLRALAPARAHPLRRDDLPELHRLLTTLRGLPGATDPARGVYVLSSSEVLNDELLRAAFRVLPAIPEPRPHIRLTANKDEPRFGFPRDLLAAAVVVVAEPLQIHVASPGQQACITAPWRAIRDPQGFGSAYSALPGAFRLDRGVTLRLLARNDTPLDASRMAHLAGEFRRLRPGTRPDEFDFSPPGAQP